MSQTLITHDDSEGNFFVSHDHCCIRVMHEDMRQFIPCSTSIPSTLYGQVVETREEYITMLSEKENRIEVCDTCKHQYACTSTIPFARIKYLREHYPEYLSEEK